MTRRRWALAVLAVAALIYALGGEWSSIKHATDENHLLDAAVGLSFFAAGIVALDRKPGNRVGPLMVAYAVTWFVGNWGEWTVPVLPSVVLIGKALSPPLIAHIALSYPSGRLRTTYDRAVLIAVYTVFLGTSFVVVLTFDPRSSGCPDCPWAPAAFPNQGVAAVATTLNERAGIVLVPLFLSAIILRWRRGSPAERRDLAPLWIATFMLALAYLLGAFISPRESDPFAYLLWEIRSVLEIGVPVVFLWGLLSTRLARSAVGDLVVELEEPLPTGDLQSALANALGDPSLEVAYAIDGDTRWVDAAGRPMMLPDDETDDRQGTITLIRQDGRPVAALLHDPALDAGLVRAVGAAAGMAIANRRLRAEVLAQLDEVRASRQRIVEAGDRERRRVERDLHDGAQQRLVALSLSLAMLRERGLPDPLSQQLVDDAVAELKQALAELRELARGIHPAILTQDGLGAAIESVAERSSVRVRVSSALQPGLPSTVEATAYFVVSEALTNVAKYARAEWATVDLRQCDHSLHIEVTDDGCGGADVRAGSGIRGLQDRVAALGGTLRLTSPPGAGTTLVADIPVDS